MNSWAVAELAMRGTIIQTSGEIGTPQPHCAAAVKKRERWTPEGCTRSKQAAQGHGGVDEQTHERLR